MGSRYARAMAGVVLVLSIGAGGCALFAVGAVGGGVAGAATAAKASEEEQHAPMTYVGTTLANCLYVPGKVVFAAGGAVTSGIAYIVTLGDSDASNSIWRSAVEGDYVLTPRMIEGKEPVHFTGS